ncbi:MAG TPA: prepilin-type N-terminal cleavage/methylation domain-containing protein [Rhodothermales bacterium]|nr:prepilin-type N-terminal cleavage/methylation domain-containing protein [Rhodothermales bacterium]
MRSRSGTSRGNREPSSRGQAGYSLIELLVVIAIIGIVSLVTVPNFMSMYQSSRLKSSVRQFTSDLRGARQRAVTQYQWVKVDVDPASSPARYEISVSTDLGTTWSTPVVREVLEPITIDSVTNRVDGPDANLLPEIIFRNNGTVVTVADGLSPGVTFKTPAKVGQPTIAVRISPMGNITAN